MGDEVQEILEASKDRQIEMLRAENANIRASKATLLRVLTVVAVLVVLVLGFGGVVVAELAHSNDHIGSQVTNLDTEVDDIVAVQNDILAAEGQQKIRGLKLRAVGCRNLIAHGEMFQEDDVCLEEEVLQYYDPAATALDTSAAP